MAPPTPPFPYALDLVPDFLPHASYRGLLLWGAGISQKTRTKNTTCSQQGSGQGFYWLREEGVAARALSALEEQECAALNVELMPALPYKAFQKVESPGRVPRVPPMACMDAKCVPKAPKDARCPCHGL